MTEWLPFDRPARHLVAEELHRDVAPPAPRRAGCAMPLLAGFFATIAVGMSMPGVAAIVMGAH